MNAMLDAEADRLCRAERYERTEARRAAVRQKAEQVAAKLREMKLADAAAIVVAGIEETLYYYAFPSAHWRCLRTNSPLERLLREVRRRTRAVGAFPDGKSALMLAAARLASCGRLEVGDTLVPGKEQKTDGRKAQETQFSGDSLAGSEA